MKADLGFLFDLPEGVAWLQVADVLEQRLAQVPEARAYPDREVEQLFAIGYVYGLTDRVTLRRFLEQMQPPVPPRVRKAPPHRVARWLARRWPNKAFRISLLMGAVVVASEMVEQLRAGYDPDLLQEALDEGAAPTYLCFLLRWVGLDEHIDPFLASLPEALVYEHRVAMRGTRLVMHEILTSRKGRSDEPQEVARENRRLRTQVRHRERLARRLAADAAAAAREAGRAGRRAKEAEAEAADLRRDAEAELAAARQRARERRRERRQELTAQEERWGAQLTELDERLAAARSDLAAALEELAGPPELRPLTGLTVTVRGDPGRQADYRLLVESTGARLVDQGADVVIEAPSGSLPEVEEALWRQARALLRTRG